MTKKISIRKNLEKIVINVGLGRLRQQSNFEDKFLPEIVKELALITGQKPSPRQAKKSIAGFKIRAGDIVGLQVTLRGKRMEDFLTRLISFVLPRVRDFRGLDLNSVDAGGNLNIGFKEQFVFPEISADKSKVNFGLQVTIVTVLESKDEAIDFYRLVGVPLKKSNV